MATEKKSACDSAGATKISQNAEQTEIQIERMNIAELKRMGLWRARMLETSKYYATNLYHGTAVSDKHT